MWAVLLVFYSSGGMRGGSKVMVEAHRYVMSLDVMICFLFFLTTISSFASSRLPGIFIAHGKEDALVTLNLTPGRSVYNEKRVSVDGVCCASRIDLAKRATADERHLPSLE